MWASRGEMHEIRASARAAAGLLPCVTKALEAEPKLWELILSEIERDCMVLKAQRTDLGITSRLGQKPAS